MLASLDAPSPVYKKKDDKPDKKDDKPKKDDNFGTPISELDEDTKKLLRD